MGADGVELDVRIAPDGRGGSRLVVFHNPLPASQAELDALPSFDDVLDACGDRMLVNVEIKNSDDEGGHDATMAVVPPTVAVMRRRGRSWADRWLFSSFDSATMDHCRRAAPEIPTALLVGEVTDEAIAAAVDAGHVAIHPWVDRLTAERVDGVPGGRPAREHLHVQRPGPAARTRRDGCRRCLHRRARHRSCGARS